MGTRCLRWSPISVAASIMFFACAGEKRDDRNQDPPRQDAGQGGSLDATAPVDRCGFAGRYRISTIQPDPAGCSALPSVTDAVAIQTGTTGYSLIAGDFEIPLELGAEECELVSSSCRYDAARDRWISVQVELQKTTGLSLAIELDEVSAHLEGACTGRFELEAAPEVPSPCGFEDTLVVDVAPALTSGTCDLSWTAEEVRIVREDNELVAHWGDRFSSDAVTLDENTCTVTIQKGVQPDFWIFNGVPRQLVMQIQRVGASYQGQFEDRLEGTSDFGETCDAMFTFTAKKQELSGELAFAKTCGVERPYVLGDGRCEMDREEGCVLSSADCSCIGPQRCISRGAGLCAVPCNVFSNPCAPNERCELANSFGSDGFCVAAGPLGEGRRCMSHAECGHGLHCQVDWDVPIVEGICLRSCDPSTVPSRNCDTLCNQFKDNHDIGGCKILCDASVENVCGGDDAFCWRRSSNSGPFCWPVPAGGVPGLNEECNTDPEYRGPKCDGALSCIGVNGPNGLFICSPDCRTSADCPPVLPVCETTVLHSCLPDS